MDLLIFGKLHEIIDKARRGIAATKVRVLEHFTMQTNGCLDTGDFVFGQRALGVTDSIATRAAVYDELGDEGVIIHGNS